MTVSEAFKALDGALGGDRNYEHDESWYSTKYQGSSDGEIQAAFVLMEKKRSLEASAILKARMDAGQYDTQVVTEGAMPRPIAKSSNRFTTFGGSMESVGDVAMLKTTVLSPDEYPDYDALAQDAWWLH
jgi:hypothetical protein